MQDMQIQQYRLGGQQAIDGSTGSDTQGHDIILQQLQGNGKFFFILVVVVVVAVLGSV